MLLIQHAEITSRNTLCIVYIIYTFLFTKHSVKRVVIPDEYFVPVASSVFVPQADPCQFNPLESVTLAYLKIFYGCS